MTTTPASAAPETGFEFFQGNATESRTRPQITVRRGGLMVLTRAAVDLLGEMEVSNARVSGRRKLQWLLRALVHHFLAGYKQQIN